ncbi:hypothetical protein H4582DRAFT_1602631 [Lactarius indigo]|nr:hypothetical protein H4582DRAFT_1602631 [Lactarius indigo]
MVGSQVEVSLFLPRVHPPVQRTSWLGCSPHILLMHDTDRLCHARFTLTYPTHPLTPVARPKSHSSVDGSLPVQQHHHHRGLVSHQMIDLASQYLAVFIQSEPCPPTPVCKRVFKTPGVVLHTEFTSILLLNRTDFDMLRTSLTRPDALHRIPTPCSWSLSPKLHASPDSARKRSPDAFERPFHVALQARRSNQFPYGYRVA